MTGRKSKTHPRNTSISDFQTAGPDSLALFSLDLRPASGLEASPGSPKTQPNSPTLNSDSTPPYSKRCILLVDDHLDTGRVLQVLLERRGYTVERAISVQSALEISARYKFDLLISDIGLPDGDGCELIELLRINCGDFSAIAISGFGTEEDIAKSLKAGFLEHMIKPFNFPALQKRIEEIFESLAHRH